MNLELAVLPWIFLLVFRHYFVRPTFYFESDDTFAGSSGMDEIGVARSPDDASENVAGCIDLATKTHYQAGAELVHGGGPFGYSAEASLAWRALSIKLCASTFG